MIDLIGQKFGMLTVICRDGNKYTQAAWKCECECGNIKTIGSDNLRRGMSKSCGCMVLPHKQKRENHPNWKGCGEISGNKWCNIKHGAKNRNILLEISIQQANELFIKQNKKCALTGVQIELPNESTGKSKGTASLDRIDSNKNYSIDNVQWVHKIVNKMKNEMSNQEFMDWCRAVAKNNPEY